MANDFENSKRFNFSPPTAAYIPTLADSTDLTHASRGIMVGVSGTVKVTMVDGGVGIPLPTLAAGVVHPICASRIWSTGTDASSFVVFY